MRLAMQDTEWLTTSEGKLLGIQGGFDYAAEHEWGIQGISNYFHLSPGSVGVDRRRTHRVPDQRLLRVSLDKAHGLFLTKGSESYYKQPEDFLKEWQQVLARRGLVFAWDEGSFGLWDSTPLGQSRVDELYAAFLAQDIFIGGGKGLTFKILSRMSSEEQEQFLVKDLDRRALEAAALATGIEKVLRDAGKGWYALSPRWADSTKTSVVFWLNPHNQQLYNYGMYSVADLRLWAECKGPIMQRGRGGRSR